MSETMKTTPRPTNLLEAIRHFSDLDVANDYVAQLRWPNGPVCPRCGCVDHSYLSTRRVWKCKGCKKQYTVKLGTIFEGSPLGFDKWLPAIWLSANTKNGISSHELGRALGITQKSAWFMLHRIRLAMQIGSIEKLDGPVEVDETYLGGKAKNMHADKRAKIGGRGTSGKVAVWGVRQRGGQTRAMVLPDTKRPTMQAHVEAHVEEGATVYSDTHSGYDHLSSRFDHATVNHGSREYVSGEIHTNNIENFWSLLKRGIKGTYVSVDPAHLNRYIDERVFAYDRREWSDYERFEAVMSGSAGRRLTYLALTSGS